MAGFQIDMSPLERSSRVVGQSLVDIGQNVGSAIQQSRQRRIQEQEQGDVEAFMRQAMSGDPVAFKELMVKSPQAANQVAQYLQQQQATQQAGNDKLAGERLLANQNTVENLFRIQTMPEQKRQAAIQELVASPLDDFDETDIPFLNDPRNLQAAAVKYFGADDAKARFGIGSKLEQGKGVMEGHSFNPSTGAYSINPALKAKLDEATQKGKLDLKDKITLNKEFTNLTKDTKGIHGAANSLSNLKKTSTATDKLAAIFKFMKSLDPTSVVREGEQTMAVRTGGAADSMVGYVNSLLGEGKLSDKSFTNMVNTAKNLANSAIDATEPEITNYLNTFGSDLSKGFKKGLMNRIPKRFTIGVAPTEEVPVSTTEMSDDEILNMYLPGGQ